MVGILLEGFHWGQFLVYSGLFSAFMLALVTGAMDLLRRQGSRPFGRKGEPWSWRAWASAVAVAVLFAAVLSSPSWSGGFAQGGIRTLPYTIFTLWFAYMFIMGVVAVLTALAPSAREKRERRASGS
jgi:hypothetical protein